ncbi:MAG: RuBisCO large subunit C-terminal-like domain-containing protein [Gammaproteobacteria bacterium]
MTLPAHVNVPDISGLRFNVQYLILGTSNEARNIAEKICNEQTVEFPESALPAGDIADQVKGRIETFKKAGDGQYQTEISYAIEIAGHDLLQLLNVVLGLTSLLNGVTVMALDFPEQLIQRFKGPRFGREGLRALIGIEERPLLCTALKPMGLSSKHLADIAYQCAVNGLDIIKDDHGITDLQFSPYEERVISCSQAVARANQITGLNCIYVANVTAPADVALERARFAKQAGAGGVMISAALTGFDVLRQLADSDDIGLPVFNHPSFSGGFLAGKGKTGFSHYVLFGQIARLAGVDVSIIINYGGRFPVTKEDSYAAVRGCRDEMGSLKPAFPCIGGGMKLPLIPELCAEYGNDSILLVGGGLHTLSDDLSQNVRDFLAAVQ